MLTFDENKVVHEIFPFHQCLESPSFVLLEKGAFDEKLAELNAIIQDEKRLASETKKYYASAEDKMSEGF